MEGDKSMEVKYYICKHCGNIVEKVKDKGVPVICCGEPMQELKAGVTDAAVEKARACIYSGRQLCSCRGRRDKTSNA